VVVLCRRGVEEEGAYLAAGADLILDLPLKADIIGLLLRFLKTYGGKSLRSHHRLVWDRGNDSLLWVPKGFIGTNMDIMG